MRFINTNVVEKWAISKDCKYHLPHFVIKLILAKIDNNTIKNMSFL